MSVKTRSAYSMKRVALLLGFVAAIIGIRMLRALHDRYIFTTNQTESLEHWAFIVDRKAPVARGDFVYFAPPANPYYRDIGFVKIVAGVPGDVVRRENHIFFVNHRRIGAAKPRSRAGEPLEPGPTGVIPSDHYFVFTPHRDSYDSRYQDIGWIGRDRIIGVARPLL